MKRYLNILVGLAAMAGMSGWGDIDGNYDEIVPDSYYTIISLKDTGVQDVNMAIADRQYDCEVAVLKGGLHTEEVVDVMVEAPDQAWVDENYNDKQGTNYKVIPASMYRITDYHLKIAAGESGKSVHVIFNAPKIYAELEKPENAGRSLVLPVRIASASKTVKTDKDVVILQCNVTPAVVSFDVASAKVKLPDNESTYTSEFIVSKSGDIDVDVRLEEMTQEYLDENYSIPQGVNYVALTPEMFSMETEAVVAAATEFYSHPVTFNIDKIREASEKGVLVLPLKLISKTDGANVSRSEMLISCNFHEYTYTDMNEKSLWSVAYGSISMPYGTFSNIIDGVENSNGWYSHITEGWDYYQDLGLPYVVLDVGSRFMAGRFGVQVGWGAGWYDTNPQAVEFYVTEDTSLDPGLSTKEYNLLFSKGNFGTDALLSDDYLAVHAKLKEFDSHVEWIKVATVTGLTQTSACCGTYMVDVPQSILSQQYRGRYVKVVLIPFPKSQSLANRAKISEVYISKVSAIDGDAI